MKNEYKALFDNIAPIKSDEELYNAVLNGKAEHKMSDKKKINKKAIIIPAAAAVVLGITTISVSAAYQRSVSNSLKEMYDKKTPDLYEARADTSNTVVSMNNVPGFDFSSVGHKEIEQVFECRGTKGYYGVVPVSDDTEEGTVTTREWISDPDSDMDVGFTVDIIGVAAESNTVLLLYDIVFDEDSDYELVPGGSCYLETNTHPYNLTGVKGSASVRDGFISMDGNVAHCYWRYDIDDANVTTEGVHFDFEANVLNRFGNYDETIGEYTDWESFKFDTISFGFDIDFDVTSNVLSLAPDVTANFHYEDDEYSRDYSAQITDIEVTPFNLHGIIMWNDPAKFWADSDEIGGKFPAPMFFNNLKVSLKDGTVYQLVELCSGLRSVVPTKDENGNIVEVRSNFSMEFDKPINVDEIQSITVGDAVIEVN